MLRPSRLTPLLYLLLPALTWSACSGDDDTTGAGGSGGSAAKAGSGGKGGSAGAKGGAAGASAGKGGKAGSGGTSASGGRAGAGGTSVTGGTGAMGGTGAVGGTGGSSGESGAAGEGATAGSGGEAGTTEMAGSGGEGNAPDKLAENIDTIVVIYAENRSFDGLFGNFPGAHGLSEVVDNTGAPTAAYVAQKDRDGTTVLPKLPKTWTGATASGNAPTVITEAETDNIANAPFPLETGFIAGGGAALTTLDVTRDMAHRFFENQMEINGGTNDMFAAWLDAGGITMGHFSANTSALYALATQYVLADNFFEGAFGGSFLNHQYLICACAPSVPAQFVASNLPSVNVLGTANSKGVPQLAVNSSSPTSALDGAPSFKTGNIAPQDYFGAGDGYRAVNTMQPAFQPSGNTPVASATDLRYANAGAANTLPMQTQTTIGDLLSAKGVTWAWYATAWDAAVADGEQASTVARTVIYTPSTPRGNPDFQAHHHPFNYYAAFDPASHADARAEHFKDYNVLVDDITQGHLPQVTFYKPTGNVNLHPGYANVDDGDTHISDLVSKLEAGPQWAHMIIVITVDEYGGQWDHVAPPKADLLGPGTRIPAIIVSPVAKKGTVDHTQYDTASILRLVTRRFGVDELAGLKKRDDALVANGKPKMGDLTNALNLK
jgi:acid phosphatase